jgi:hypothetical protein
MKIKDLTGLTKTQMLESDAGTTTTSAAIPSLPNPGVALGKKNIGNKSYTGSPGKSGTKAPKLPKIVQKKNKDGTAKNALDMNQNVFGSGVLKRR